MKGAGYYNGEWGMGRPPTILWAILSPPPTQPPAYPLLFARVPALLDYYSHLNNLFRGNSRGLKILWSARPYSL